MTGKEGPLAYPVFEADGNHDRNRNWIVRERIAERHGGRFYSFDFYDLHLVCLGEAPDEDGLAFLDRDLAQVEKDAPSFSSFITRYWARGRRTTGSERATTAGGS